MGSDMGIDARTEDGVARITMSGRFDFHQLKHEFRSAYTPIIEDAAVLEIEVELSRVSYLDSSALGMLLQLNQRAGIFNKSVTLLNPCGATSQVLEVANFRRLFKIRHSAQ
jgi:anti-anti-sigma factor